MTRIMSLDYGKKRTGIAISDPLRIIASPVETVDTNELIGFIKKYIQIHEVDTFVVGYPLALDGNPTDATALVDKFLGKGKKLNKPVQRRTFGK